MTEQRTDNGTEIASTELAEEEEAEQGSSYVPQGMRAKRKRVSSESTRTASHLDSAFRLAKRSKILAAPNSSGVFPIRVIAFWKGDGYYYPGTVMSMIKNSTKFKIHFDDDTEDDVDIERMRASLLKVKDEVFLNDKNRKAVVTDVSDWAGDNTLTIEYTEGKENVEMEIHSTDFKIAARTLNAQWKDRILSLEDVVPPQAKRPPSKSLSVASTSNLLIKALSGKGFVLTASDNDASQKDTATELVRQLGGTVLNDWSEVYSLRGRCANKRWSIKSEDIKYIYRGQIEQVFLLSDSHSAKPKFLTALALGIPCISFDYLADLSLDVSFMFC